MKVGVFCNREAKKFADIRGVLFAQLQQAGVAYEVYEKVEEMGDVDVLIVLGGDGTILKAAIEDNERLMRHFGIQWIPTRSFVVHVPPVSTFQRRTTRWRAVCRGNICILASWCRRTFSGSWRRRCASTTR